MMRNTVLVYAKPKSGVG